MESNNKCNRIEAGKKIFENPDVQILRLDDHHYTVNSQSRNKQHDVISTEFGWICSCEDHSFRGTQCKHIHGVKFSIKLRVKVRERNEVIINELTCDKCPQCESTNITKHGIRHNKNYDLQRFSCKDCKKRFSFNLGFERMAVNPKVITSAMQLYFTGESLRNVQKFIKLQGVTVVHSTIYSWIKKYVSLMDNYLKTITPQVGDRWHADEVWLKIKGDKKYINKINVNV